MVTIVFRSRLRPGVEAAFSRLGDEMLALAREMPGFVSYKVFVAEDGERCTVIGFETAEQLRAWREHPEHRADHACSPRMSRSSRRPAIEPLPCK